MRLFRTSRKLDGWRAVAFTGNAIHVAHVRRVASGKPQVTLAAAVPVSGAAIAAALDNFGKAWAGTAYRCTTLLGPKEYQLLPLETPNVPPNELKSAVSWLVRDMLDFHVDEATIDVLNIPADKNAGQRSAAMYAVATRSKLVEERQRLFEEAKVSLQVIDIPEMAQRNIASLIETPERGVGLLSFDSDGGLLTFTSGGELYLARRIDVALAQLNSSDNAQKEAMHEKIALEVQRSLDHFGRQFRYIPLSSVMLAPLGDSDGGLQSYLADNVDMPVEALDLDTVFDFSATPELRAPRAQQEYFLALGAALRLEEKAL